MSEQLSTNDIEDVLSSVRRLLSPEARPRPVSRDLGQDKLLLTPALRVVTDAQTPLILKSADAEAQDSEQSVSEMPVLEAPTLDVPTPEMKAADPVIPDAIDVVAELPSAMAEADVPLHVVEGEWEDAFWSEPETTLAELALGTEEAELVTAAEPATQTEPANASQPAPELAAQAEETAAPGLMLDPFETATPEVPLQEPASNAGADDEALLDDSDLDDSDLAHAEPTPSEPTPSELAPSELARSEFAETMTDQDGNPVTVLDEEALNQIVRHLIREELQGVLGERITHNVRKLVRAEINRALTARSLD